MRVRFPAASKAVLAAVLAIAILLGTYYFIKYSYPSPLIAAIRNADTQRIELLLGKKDRVNQRVGAIGTERFDEWTPLMWAMHFRRSDIALTLLERGADVHLVDPGGKTALHIAIQCDCQSCVELLVARGASVNAQTLLGESPLHFAVVTDNTKLIRLLVENGADLESRSSSGLTPLGVAIINRPKMRAVHELIRSGADLDIDLPTGETARERLGKLGVPLGEL